MYRLAENKLNDFLAALAKVEKLYLPVKDDSSGAASNFAANYKEWKEGVEYADCLNTSRSAKDFFFPQTENLFELKMSGKNIEVIDTRKEHEDFVIFGVRACDVQSFAVLDNVYLKQQPVDTYYKNRREHATIIAMACAKPAQTCFCQNIGIDAANPGSKDGAVDARAWKKDGNYYFEAVSEKGKALLAKVAAGGCGLAEDAAAEKAVEDAKAAIKAEVAKLPIKMPDNAIFDEKNLKTVFNAKVWGELSETCLACGTCTFVCPTCQCYDIRDFDTGSGIRRFRCWDSCMYSDFTKMSAGQPRLTQLERFRQRFMHKLVYYPSYYNGMAGCVGCGRCLAKCPISMNIVKVAKALSAELENKEGK